VGFFILAPQLALVCKKGDEICVYSSARDYQEGTDCWILNLPVEELINVPMLYLFFLKDLKNGF